MSQMRIAFVIPNLGPGGAERVASLLCNDWAGQGHDVTLLTFEEAGAELAYREVADLSHAYPREENARILEWFDPGLALP